MVDVDTQNNRVTVTYDREDPLLYSDKIHVKNMHWIHTSENDDLSDTALAGPIQIKIRYRQKHTQHARIEKYDAHSKQAVFVCDSPQWAVTPGQILVIYQDDRIL